MDKRSFKAAVIILAILISITLFVSPENREPLVKEYGNSGIGAWEYMPEGPVEGQISGFPDTIGSRREWKSLDMPDARLELDSDVFWLRGRLPENFSLFSPELLLEFDFPVEVYIDGYRVYSYGKLKDRNRVLCYQHLIPLHEEYKGKMIYFRYPRIKGLTVRGLRHLTAWDMVSGSVKIKSILRHEMISLILCTSGVIIGLCLIILAIYQRRLNKYEAYIMASAGSFVLLTSISMLSTFYGLRTALGKPMLIFYMDYVSYFLIPYAAGKFIIALLQEGPKNHLRAINAVFLHYLIFVLILSLNPGFDISKADYVFNASLLIYALAMLCLVVKELRGGNKKLRLILVGTVATGLTGVLDILIELRVLHYETDFTQYGIFTLAVCMTCFFGLRYSKLYSDAKATNIQLIKSKEMIEEINRSLDKKVIEKASAIKSLFDNAEQGFLSIKADLMVENEYSLKCKEIFGRDIGGESLPKLIGNANEEQEEFIGTLLNRIFSMQDAEKREVYISLLPTGLALNGKLVNIDYKLIDKHEDAQNLTCMVILTDVTEKHLLEQKLEQERSIMKMAVKVVANHNDFANVVYDYKDFCSSRAAEILKSGIEADSKYAELFRAIHTFKGTFAQFEMHGITKKLHDLETAIDCFRKENSEIEEAEALLHGDNPETWLEEEIDVLSGVLGQKFIGEDKLVIVEEARLKEIESRIMSEFKGSEGVALTKELKKLRFRSIKDMLRNYPDYCLGLSERLEKPINDFEIEGPDIAVDPDKYKNLAKVLGHVFRNAIDHGIEAPEERVRSGKSEVGSISCCISEAEGAVKIAICDDGAGIDLSAIRKKAVGENLMISEAAVSGEEIVQALFADGFTTAEAVTELSGRGVGLAAVKAEVEKLKGRISIDTEKGKGTSISIIVPLLD